ncbi:hypothetical protein [Spirillospora sp. NPDC029432]|uniref:hypothetical protein n=1 Tax=Spirillospora sp. NPDC029432 TaxID=3154599 RepID=UPI003453A001
MKPDEKERARRWLAEEGITGDGGWTDPDGRPITANEIAHECAMAMLEDPGLDGAGRLELAFGLLDLLDDYWVTCEMRFAVLNGKVPRAVLWDGYRRRLERDAEPAAITYSLWVDWFEDRGTVAEAFAEVLAGTPGEHRLRHVLECSGPVPWELKLPVLRDAAADPALRDSVFRALRAAYHDFYGDLVPEEALAMLEGLGLPPGTEHLDALRTVLAAGHRNHYRSPAAWGEASASSRDGSLDP